MRNTLFFRDIIFIKKIKYKQYKIKIFHPTDIAIKLSLLLLITIKYLKINLINQK